MDENNNTITTLVNKAGVWNAYASAVKWELPPLALGSTGYIINGDINVTIYAGMVLEVLNDGTDAGTEVVWGNKTENKTGQQWEFGFTGQSEYFTIKHPASGKLLTAVEGNLNLTIESISILIF